MFSNPVNRTAHLSASRGFRVAPIAAFALLISLTCAGAGGPEIEAGDEIRNPILTDPDAITQGRRFYRARCIICHLKAGGKGPKIFRSDLTDEQFLEVVINGRDGTQMPAFGERMSPDDVWAVHAYVMSRDRY